MKPPGWLRRVVAWAAGPEARWVVADLDEEFSELAATRGAAVARRWYAGQVARSIGPLLRQRGFRPVSWPRPRPLGLDFRSALRRIRRARLATAAIVLTIAIGIGATTAVSSVVRGVLLKSLPYPDSDRIVRLFTIDPDRPGDIPSETWADLERWRRDAHLVEAIGGIWGGGINRTVTFEDRVVRFPVAAVTRGFDAVFRVPLILGRAFTPAEYLPDGPKPVLLTERFWRAELGGDPGVVGRTLLVADTAREIVGVLADAANEFPPPATALWIPVTPRPGHWMASDRSRWVEVFGRLRPGASVAGAEAELRDLVAAAATGDRPRRIARAIPLALHLTGPVRPVLLLLSAAVVVALVVACANAAILVLAQAETRVRELAVRAALGSSRSDFGRLLALETLLTAGAGGVAGIILARPLVNLFLRLYPERLVRSQDIAIDPAVLGGAVVAVTAVCLAVSWPTARRARRVDLVNDLKAGGGGGAGRRGWFRSGLVVGQLALAVALVTGGTLLVRSYATIAGVDPGFDPSAVTYLPLSASAARHGDRLPDLYADILARVKAVPGVEVAGTVNYLPLPTTTVGWGSKATRPDRPGEEYEVQFRHVTGDYREVLRLPLRRGRQLGPADGAAAPPVALVNETFAAGAFPGVDPLGRVFRLQGREWEIVGVVGDMRYWGLAKPVVGEVYVPLSQGFAPAAPQFFAGQTLIVRSALPVAALRGPLERAIRAADPAMAIGTATAMSARVDRALAPERFRAVLVGGLGAIALVLSALGIYAVMAYTVAGRTREIGIRMALGAAASRVRAEVLRDAGRLAAIGAGLGMLLAAGTARFLRGFLIGVTATDSATLAMVTIGFLLVALAAAVIPARRASRANPLDAIRAD